MKFDDAPRLPKIPFLLGNLGLLAAAWFIYAYAPNPFSPIPLFFIFVFFLVGILASMVPFVVNYNRDQADAATALRHELDEQFKRLISASEHLQNSTLQLKSIGEIATRNFEAAERLPSRMQDRIAEFNQQLAATENKEKARLEQELTRLRSGESERQAAAAAQIAAALTEWTRLETDARQTFTAMVLREKELFEQQAATLRAIDSERQAAAAVQITNALDEWAKIEADARRNLASMVQREKEVFERQAVTVRTSDNERQAAATAQIATALAEWTKIEADARRSLADMVQQEKSLFQQQVVTLRATENERVAAAAEEITMTLASWTGIEAGVRRQLASATELQEKLGGVLFSLAGRIADLQTALELAMKAAEAIPVAPAPAPMVLPSPAPVEVAPIVAESPAVAENPPVLIEVPATPELNLDSAVEASAPRSGERQPLDMLGALSLSKRQADSASTAELRSNSALPETTVEPAPLAPPEDVQPAPEAAVTDVPVTVSVPEIAQPPAPSEPSEPPAIIEATANPPAAEVPAPVVVSEVIPPPAPSEPAVAAEEPAPVSATEEPMPVSQPEIVLESQPPLALEPLPPVSEVTPAPESSETDLPEANSDETEPPALPSDSFDPTATPKPRKPRAPRKPKTESIAPAETVAEPAVESAPAAESPVEQPPPLELIAEPVSDEPATPEDFSQVSPDENKPAGKPSPDGRTRLTVTSYIGIGNKLHIRGEGAGLSWSKGIALQFVSIGRWRWETDKATEPVTFKIYKNDRLEAPNGEITLLPGTELEISATF
jgi:hypothetical protein